MTPEAERSHEQRDAVTLAGTLVDELTTADAMIFAVPLYNFGVSQHFKIWVDLVITDPRMAAGVKPATAGTPAVLATVRGGYYAPGTPRECWDHATPWMRRILQDVWQLDLLVVETDFTFVGVNPALTSSLTSRGTSAPPRRSGRLSMDEPLPAEPSSLPPPANHGLGWSEREDPEA